MTLTNMTVMIPTRGRKVHETVNSLKGCKYHVVLVCPKDEVDFLFEKYNRGGSGVSMVLEQPDHITTIAAKRKWMLEFARREGSEKVLMLDDDLFFYRRRDDVPDRLRDANADDINEWFDKLNDKLSPEIPHAGFGPRQGNQNQPTGWVVGRMMLALGYYVPTVLDNAILDRINTREDMDVTLQLLRAGFPNAVTHEFVVGQKSYSAPGGCDLERTLEISNADAYRLADLHPGFVSVVDKNYKNVPRKEVICYWKRALAEGTQRRKTV